MAGVIVVPPKPANKAVIKTGVQRDPSTLNDTWGGPDWLDQAIDGKVQAIPVSRPVPRHLHIDGHRGEEPRERG